MRPSPPDTWSQAPTPYRRATIRATTRPHAKAKRQYQRIVPNDFLCTHQHPNPKNPEPIVFEVTQSGFAYLGETDSNKSMSEALAAAGGAAAMAPATAVGFGRGAQ